MGYKSNYMLAEIIKELTKTEKSKAVTSEQVLAWAKILEAQKAQSIIINGLNKTKNFDQIKTIRRQRQIKRKVKTHACQSAKKVELWLFWFQPSTQVMSSLW